VSFADEIVVSCNECSTNASFRNLASSATPGRGARTVTVINFESGKAKRYLVEYMDNGQDSMLVTTASLETSYVNQAKSIYNQIKTDYASYIADNYAAVAYPSFQNIAVSDYNLRFPSLTASTTSSGAIANGCGTPSHYSYHIIPDYPFESACNAHDICYSSSADKDDCDMALFDDMIDIAYDIAFDNDDLEDAIPDALEPYIQAAIFNALAYISAEVHGFLSTSRIAFDAYCSNKSSSNRFCNTDDIGNDSPADNDTAHTVIDRETSGGVRITVTCYLLKLPDGFGGHYYMYGDCSYSMDP
jgi:hypothetical protein